MKSKENVLSSGKKLRAPKTVNEVTGDQSNTLVFQELL